MILSDFYLNPIDLVNEPYSRHAYDLKITWEKGVTLESIREHVSKKLQNELNYYIESDLRQEQVYRMLIIDEVLLDKNYSNLKLSEGTTSKRTILNNQWEFYGKINGLAELITEQTGRKISGVENINKELYYFRLNAVGGFSGIKKQLRDNYGIALNEETVSVEYYVITFE